MIFFWKKRKKRRMSCYCLFFCCFALFQNKANNKTIIQKYNNTTSKIRNANAPFFFTIVAAFRGHHFRFEKISIIEKVIFDIENNFRYCSRWSTVTVLHLQQYQKLFLILIAVIEYYSNVVIALVLYYSNCTIGV